MRRLHKDKCQYKLLACGAERLSWLLTLQKLPMVLHQVMFSLSTVGRPLTSMSRTIVPVSSVQSFSYSGVAPKSSVSSYLLKMLCTALFFKSIGVSLSGRGEGSSFSNSFSKTDTSVSYLEKCKPWYKTSLAIVSASGWENPCATASQQVVSASSALAVMNDQSASISGKCSLR